MAAGTGEGPRTGPRFEPVARGITRRAFTPTVRVGTMPFMGPTRTARRALTPLLVLLVVAPPRVCTCDHAHAAEPSPVVCLADPPVDPHEDDHDDHDCPCLKPVQLKPTILAAGVPTPLPPALYVGSADSPAVRPTADSPAPPARRTGDPPLYLTGCALRF